MLFRYSRWDGTQQLADLDADDLLAAMSDDLMSDGDLWNALRRMFQRGVQNPQGSPVPGIQDMLDRLRKRRQQQLDRYDLGSALEDIKKKLDEVIRTERAGVDREVKDQGERSSRPSISSRRIRRGGSSGSRTTTSPTPKRSGSSRSS